MGSKKSSEISKDSKFTVFGSGLLTHSNISVMFEISYFKGIKKKKKQLDAEN